MNHPAVPEGSAALCPYLLRGAGSESPHVLSNGGVVPKAIYVVTLIDMIGVGLVIPLIPAFAKRLGASPTAVGLMGTIYGLAQLVGASYFGEISDSRGRRHVLQLSMLGAALGYALIALSAGRAQSLVLLMFSRVPIGITKQTMTMSRAVIADCTAVKDRIGAFSKLATIVAVCFCVCDIHTQSEQRGRSGLL